VSTGTKRKLVLRPICLVCDRLPDRLGQRFGCEPSSAEGVRFTCRMLCRQLDVLFRAPLEI
jgi:hypothetical protein